MDKVKLKLINLIKFKVDDWEVAGNFIDRICNEHYKIKPEENFLFLV